jgi:protein involved in polysaccharide export with SLBB domain
MVKTSLLSINPLIARLISLLLLGSTLFAMSESARADGYPLEAGDVLSVIVQRHPEMSADEVTINAAGKARLPEIGEIAVAGKTIDQVARQIARVLASQLVHPEVTVTLKKSRPRPISVLGEVKTPGIYEAAPGWRVTEVLSAAGGLIIKPESAGASLTRRDGKIVPLDLSRIFSEAEVSNNPTVAGNANVVLQGGEVLRVWARTIKISVTGWAQRPGTYEAAEGSGIIEAIALAGGAAPRAALSKVVVTRANGSIVRVNLLQAMLRGDQESNLKLETGDLITILEAKDRVTVRGAVQKPGYYEIEDGASLRVAEAVALAAGTLPRAALTRVRVEHADGNSTTVNLFKVMSQGDRSADVELVAGDVVTVPESRGVTVLGEVLKPGNYSMEDGAAPRISDVLAEAGGMTGKAQGVSITLTRTLPDGQVTRLSIDPVALIEGRDANQNQSVQDGDLITIAPQRTQTVIVSGEVKTPGVYELKAGSSLPELIARAGGPTEDAALRRVSITARDNTMQVVDGFAAIHQGGKNTGLPLRDGDFVVVPKNTARVLILPAVNKPGYYPIPEGEPLTVGSALALAGGPKERARLKEVAIFRHTPTGVERQIIALDRVTSGQLSLDIPLQSDDVLYVPEGKQSTSMWNGITSALGSLGVLSSIF